MRSSSLLLLAIVLGGSAACHRSTEGPAKVPSGVATPTPAPDASQIVDDALRDAWQKQEITPAKPVADGRFLRRAYLDIVGRIPTLEELTAFLSDPSLDKRSKAIDALLAGAEYAKHWTRYWDDVLLGDKIDKNIVDRDEFDRWLEARFSQNTPWDEIAVLLVTAQGTNRTKEDDSDAMVKAVKSGQDLATMSGQSPSKETPDDRATEQDHVNGAVNWLLKYRDDPQDLAGNLSATFLGVKIQCAQCHDHKTEKWKQRDFQQLAACLTTAKVIPIDAARDGGPRRFGVFEVKKPFVRVANQPELAAIAQAAPVTLDGTDLSQAESRREAFGEWMRSPKNPWFAKAIVNRVWGYFMGRGFVEPIDDFRPSNPVLLPELLDALANDFVAHRYDLKRLIAAITKSQAYQLAAEPRTAAGSADPLFSRYALKPLGPDELLDSIAVATELDTLLAGKNAGEFGTAKSQLRKQFGFLFDVDEESHPTSYDGTIPQALLLMNGRPLSRATNTVRQGALLKVLAMPGSDTEKLESLFLRTVARPPTSDELAKLLPLLQARPMQRQERFEDIFWALLNSSEFIFNH
jgi:hypothetical protein